MIDFPGPIENCEGWYLERVREMNNATNPDEIERVLDQVREQVIAKRCFAYWLSEARSHAAKVLRRNGWERAKRETTVIEMEAFGMNRPNEAPTIASIDDVIAVLLDAQQTVAELQAQIADALSWAAQLQPRKVAA